MHDTENWRKTDEKSTKVGWRWLTEKTFIDPAGETQTFTTYGKPGTHNVAVIALTKDKQVVLAKQFRQGPEAVFFELPGGAAESAETDDLQAAAARELSEETGYRSDAPLLYLGKVCRDAYTNDINHYFLANDCYAYREAHPDRGEFVEVAIVSIPQLLKHAKNCEMSDVAGVFLAMDALHEATDA